MAPISPVSSAATIPPAGPGIVANTSSTTDCRRALIHWRQLGLAAQDVGGALGDHDDRGVDVAADRLGEHRGIDHPQAVDAADAEFGIDHGGIVAADPAGAGGMVDRRRRRADEGVDLVVGAHVGGRHLPFAEEALERLGRGDPAYDLHALAQRPAVVFGRQKVVEDAHRRRRVAPALAQLPHERGVGPAGARERLERVTAAEGAHHRRGVGHVAAGDEVLEERQERIVQRDVGRGLRGGRPGEEGEGRDEGEGAGHGPGNLTAGPAGST